MKKYISIIIAAAFVLGMSTGCSSDAGSSLPDSSVGEPLTSDKSDTPTPAANSATETASTEYKPTDIGGTGSKSGIKTTDGFLDAAAGISAADTATGSTAAVAEADEDYYLAETPDEFTGKYFDEYEYPICELPPYDEFIIEPSAGLLTGGEWRDNDHWSDWNALYSSHEEWNQYKTDWRIGYDMRIAVKVTADGQPLEGAKVTCPNATSAVTDNNGMAYLFYAAINGPTEPITVSYGSVTQQLDGVLDNASVECELSGVTPSSTKKLDLMIMCDTTGSMSDELCYLQEELKDIVSRVKSDNANIPTRLSINFYRDEGDEYIVREYPFTEDIDAASKAIGEQEALGGGDFPEAVHTALDNAINDHDWDEDAVKIMFLVLDAPPHSDTQIVDSVNSLIKEAAEQGIRIIPIASSGIDKSTEYLLRTMAFTTGGTYTFLTDDSGIGGGHIKPTVGAYNVEKLNDMMVRIVNGYLE